MYLYNMVVYFHRNPISYDIFYVGIGKKENRAFRLDRGRNPYWINIVKKYGKPIVQIVFDNITDTEAKNWERFYIKLLGRKIDGGPLANISEGGDCQPPVPEESRKKATAALIAWLKANPEKNPMNRPEIRAKLSGDKSSSKRPEVREKLRVANIGKIQSDETKAKNSAHRKGKTIPHLVGYKHSPEVIERLRIINKEIANRPSVKEKQSLKKKGCRNFKNGVAVNMIHPDTGLIIKTYPTIADALIEFKKPLNFANISSVLKGNRIKALGYKWQYA